MNGSTSPSVDAPKSLLTQPLAAGNKGITTAIVTAVVSGLAPVLASHLPPWLQVDPGVAVPAIGLSLQNLFARLRDRRRQRKAWEESLKAAAAK